jgi:hypothetical protein
MTTTVEAALTPDEADGLVGPATVVLAAAGEAIVEPAE